MKAPNRKLPLWASLFFLAWGSCAQADIYRFVDADGSTHYSNVRQDHRYSLILRSDDGRSAAQPPAARKPEAKVSSQLLQRQQAYSSHVAGVASALRLDAALLHAVITAESGYNPRARSGKGAMGLMQLMPSTARRYCVRDPYDPLQNLHGGSLYLRDLLQRYHNNPKLALAAYNAGEEAVARHGNQIPPYRETQLYVPLVMALYERYRQAPDIIAASRGDKPLQLASAYPGCDVQ